MERKKWKGDLLALFASWKLNDKLQLLDAMD